MLLFFEGFQLQNNPILFLFSIIKHCYLLASKITPCVNNWGFFTKRWGHFINRWSSGDIDYFNTSLQEYLYLDYIPRRNHQIIIIWISVFELHRLKKILIFCQYQPCCSYKVCSCKKSAVKTFVVISVGHLQILIFVDIFFFVVFTSALRRQRFNKYSWIQ